MISSGRPKVRRLGVTKTALPSPASTRAASASVASASGTCSSECTDSTEVNEPEAKGSARMSAITVSRPWPSSASADRSTPTVSRGSSSR